MEFRNLYRSNNIKAIMCYVSDLTQPTTKAKYNFRVMTSDNWYILQGAEQFKQSIKRRIKP